MKKNKLQESPAKTQQVYRQYIQFINEFNVTLPLSFLFLLLSNIVILSDLLLQLAPNNNFIKDLTYLGISSILLQINIQNGTLSYLINFSVIVILLSPIYSFLTILFWSKTATAHQNGTFKQIYEKSFINTSIRAYAVSFPYFWLPIFISYASKIFALNLINQALGIIIIMLTAVNCFLIEYHIFQLGNGDVQSRNLVSLNYPYHIVDDGLVFVGLIIINLSSGVASQIVGLLTVLMRLFLGLYMPFYNKFYHKYYTIVAISASIASFGFLVSYFNMGQYYNIILIIILIIFLLHTKYKRQPPVWQEIQPVQRDQQQLLQIKKRLYNKGLFARSFRQLILLGRKNNSHRNLLEIQILKSKCSAIQKLNRGGSRMCGSRDVIRFQQLIVKFISNFLNACELSVSILKFVQTKQPKKQILGKAVQNLVNLLMDNKIIIKKLFQINQYSSQAKFLLIKTFSQLYNDNNFMRQAEKWTSDSMQIDGQKELKERLFNQKTAVIFINILQQMGKVIKISKNLPSVLGYEPNNLIGLSINEIIPFSVKPFHDENMLQYIERYSHQELKKDRHLNFYAYNHDFHLQQVAIRNNWIMSDFHTFHMTGILQKVESQTHIILTDQYGNLEGWTKKIGAEQLNLDELSISQRKNYNIMPLFPTLIKYMDSLGVCVKTLFFKNSKPRDSNLIIVDSQKKENISAVQPRLLSAFRKMLKQQEIVGACFAEVQFTKIILCHGKVKMWQITIREYDRVQNISEINSIIQRLMTNNNTNIRTEKSLASCTQVMAQSSQKQQLSIFSQQNIANKKMDSIFTLDCEGENIISFQQLVFGQFNVSRTSFELNTVYQNPLRRKIQHQQKGPMASPDASYNPTLQRHSTLFWYVLLVTLGFLTLYIFNLVSVISAGSLFAAQCQNVISRNKAASIYLKSIFNPNMTYISRFSNGSLLQNMQYLYGQSFNYTTFLGNKISQNKYYLFNTQIAATLQRLVSNPIAYTNQTINIIPPTNAGYYTQITANYLGVVNQFDIKFNQTLSVWNSTINNIQGNFFIRLAFLCISTFAYAILLVLMHIRERRHKETLEAFFKFQKEDLQRKINSIGVLVREIQSQSAQMNLLKQFSEIVKKEQIINIQFSLIKNLFESKIKFDHDQQTENNIQKKKYYMAMVILILFLITQTVFLVLHSVTCLKALSFYNSAPSDLDQAAKLIVYPNFQLAGLYLPLQSNISTNYENIVNQVLAFPISSIPQLFSFVSNVPCANCTFMYPVLTTNFKSFYSTFQQRVVDIKTSNSINNSVIQDLFYAADYVIEEITPVLTITYTFFQPSVAVYAISMIILCAAIYMGTKSINTEIQKLEVFLGFFSQQTITKNKHMNRLFSNTT